MPYLLLPAFAEEVEVPSKEACITGDAASSKDGGYSLTGSKEDYMNTSDYSYVCLGILMYSSVCLGVVATFNFESSE